MPTMTLKPAPGLRVRRPDGAPLAPQGEAVDVTSYWLRRLADGDVAVVDKSRAAKAAPVETKE